MKVLNYRVIIEQDEDGMFVASVPTLQGCYTEADTFDEVLENIKDVITLHVAARAQQTRLPDDSKSEFVGIKTITIPYGISAHS
ncbi:type II toxin-antitoxin system HicB family antitoxin [Candidatus Gottesmanbacteria bacterium]|nr:type II toxin-antitoxin system HicB family antitoxin [Candidatus Gottesmanbacteria bacterium]